MRFREFKLSEVPDDGSRAGQEPNSPVNGQQNLEAGPPYPTEQVDAVKALQTKLEELGYSVGSTGIDGKYGPRTTRAVAAYMRDFNVQNADRGRSIDNSEIQAMQTRQPVNDPTPTGNENGGGGAAAVGGQPGSLEGTNVLAANTDERQLPNQNIIDALDRAASERGIQVQITPNGGRAGRDTGTKNHPPGEAADIQIVQGGRVIRPGDNSGLYDDLIQTLVTNAARRGVRPGIGGYSWGIHYDESSWRQGGDGIAGKWGSSFVQTGINLAKRGLA